jgi:quercetin dioxygenase-like cupin family protein
MIRCVRLWTGEDMASHFEEGHIELGPGPRADSASVKTAAATVAFQETPAGGTLPWHTAPIRQLVLTLGGTLRFEMGDGQSFVLGPGDTLLAEDTTGGGHSWRIIGDQPWRRVYVVLPPGVAVPFVPASKAGKE